MDNKELLLNLLKNSLGNRLIKLEKKYNEEESSLKLIKTSFNGFTKKISDLIKLREQKIAKDKIEEQKKLAKKQAEEARKNKKKEPPSKGGRKSIMNSNMGKKTNTTNKLNTITKTKSSTNLNKKPLERKRGKSVSRLNTDTGEMSRNTIGANNSRRKTLGKKDTQATEPPRRNTIGGKKGLKPSRSMGKLLNKPTLKKASSGDNKKKEIEEMQKMVNNIKIQNKDLEKEEEKKEEEEEKKTK